MAKAEKPGDKELIQALNTALKIVHDVVVHATMEGGHKERLADVTRILYEAMKKPGHGS